MISQYTELRALAAAGTRTTIDEYRDLIAQLDLRRLNDTERKALFLNAYNVFAMSMLIHHSCHGDLCTRYPADGPACAKHAKLLAHRGLRLASPPAASETLAALWCRCGIWKLAS